MREEYTPDVVTLLTAYDKHRMWKGVSMEEAEAEFDRAIAKIKAEAWEEGMNSGLDTTCQYACGDCKNCVNIPSNPYETK